MTYEELLGIGPNGEIIEQKDPYEDLVTIDELAEHLKVSRSFYCGWKLVHDSRIPMLCIGRLIRSRIKQVEEGLADPNWPNM